MNPHPGNEPRSLAAQLQTLHNEERERRIVAELRLRRACDRLSLAGVTEDEINALLEEASR